MRTAELIDVKSLRLDLFNFRTVPQKSERKAVHAMITINPDWFWELTKSLLDDGYSPTENIIVLKDATGDGRLVVKEGNRRVAAMKLILGHCPKTDLDIPQSILDQMAGLSRDWKQANFSLPCLVYSPEEEEAVDVIVSRIHGKGDKASRDKWVAVAKARHNREKNSASEPGLDTLDEYLKSGSNLTPRERELWAGTFPLSILDEAVKKLATAIGSTSAKELAKEYAKDGQHRGAFENLLLLIGKRNVGFDRLRNESDAIFRECGFPLPTVADPSSSSVHDSDTGTSSTGGDPSPASKKRESKDSATGTKPAAKRETVALASTDPRSIKRSLKSLKPKGKKREKLVTLLNEAVLLDVGKTPHAFCFVLRSLFELSARAYCNDHQKAGGPSYLNNKGQDRNLADVLRDIERHLTNGGSDKQREKELHGAMTEIDRSRSPLSVTSMNQLIHGQVFSLTAQHISTVFNNLFPLLEAMNS